MAHLCLTRLRGLPFLTVLVELISIAKYSYSLFRLFCSSQWIPPQKNVTCTEIPCGTNISQHKIFADCISRFQGNCFLGLCPKGITNKILRVIIFTILGQLTKNAKTMHLKILCYVVQESILLLKFLYYYSRVYNAQAHQYNYSIRSSIINSFISICSTTKLYCPLFLQLKTNIKMCITP